MKMLPHRTPVLFALYSAAAAWAHAHPGHQGHEGGEFTWDFSHLVSNPLATLGYLTLLALAVIALRSRLRNRSRLAARSTSESADSR